MATDDATRHPQEVREWDVLATELQELRRRMDEPSYAELTRRIVDRRIREGMDPHAARVARSSVYDAFRMGRTRGNLAFIREVVQALGAAPSLVDEWLAHARTPVVEPAQTAVSDEPTSTSDAVPTWVVLLLMAALVGVNLLGRVLVDTLALPIYLDMLGTAIAALALGPWRGAAVGAVTNVAGLATGSAFITVPFALVNVAGALVWGYGARRFNLGQTLPRYFFLSLLTAVVCSAIAVPILLAAYGGELRMGHDAITVTVRDVVPNLWLATSISNLLASSADKLISGFVALVALTALPLGLRRGCGVVLADPLVPLRFEDGADSARG